MISWTQDQLSRHGRWIFLGLLAILVIAFVFTIGNTPGCTTSQSRYEKQLFYGYDLNSSYEMNEFQEKVTLSTLLNTGRTPQNQQQFQASVIRRIALLALADEIGIPGPEQRDLADYIQSRAPFRGPDGQFSRDAYTRFVDNVDSNPALREELILVVLEEDYRIEQVQAIIAGPGYFLPSEAISQVQLNETTIKPIIAELSFSEFSPEIAPSEDTLEQFYTDNLKRYEIPEKIRANYVKFPSANYVSQVGTLSEEALQDHFINNRARLVSAWQAAQPETDAGETSSAQVTFEDVRTDVIDDLTAQKAEKLANLNAQNFALSLYRNEIPKDSEAFTKLLEENNLTLSFISPYSIDQAGSRPLPKKMLESASTLDDTRYFSDAYKLNDGFGVLILSDKVAPVTPSYEAVAKTVSNDYNSEQKRRLFSEEGERLKNELQERIDNDGTSFASEAEALGLAVTPNDAFKLSEPPATINAAVLQATRSMKEGELSPMITSGDSGVFIYLEERTTPEIADDNESLVQTNNFLQRYAAFISSDALLNELISAGLGLDGASSR